MHLMAHVQRHFLVYVLTLSCFVLPDMINAQSRYDIASDGAREYLHIPGLVYALRHNVNQGPVPLIRTIIYPGGDLGASSGQGFFYVAMPDGQIRLSKNYNKKIIVENLPPGIVLGLRHSVNQAESGPRVFGCNVLGRRIPTGLAWYAGGDLGASAGEGFYWYETLGSQATDWSLVDFLPCFTVIGLKHSVNQPGKILYWAGRYYDPVNPHLPPPPGFQRMVGGDLGGSAGEGYYWYEKITGPVIRIVPYME